MLEMERRNGKNKESLDLFLNTLLNVQIYKKYSTHFQAYSRENISNRARKLSKKNSENLALATGSGAVIAAFAATTMIPIIGIPLGIGLVSGTLTGAVNAALNAKQKKEMQELINDIKSVEQSDNKNSFFWMQALYKVRESIQDNKFYRSFQKSLKEVKDYKEKEALFDDYIDLLLKDLCQ